WRNRAKPSAKPPERTPLSRRSHSRPCTDWSARERWLRNSANGRTAFSLRSAIVRSAFMNWPISSFNVSHEDPPGPAHGRTRSRRIARKGPSAHHGRGSTRGRPEGRETGPNRAGYKRDRSTRKASLRQPRRVQTGRGAASLVDRPGGARLRRHWLLDRRVYG